VAGERPAVPAESAVRADPELFIRAAFREDARKGCELLFKRYYHPLCNHAVRFVYSRTVAEDLVADLFHDFWKSQRYQRVQTSYRAYLFSAVRHRAYNYLRWECTEKQEYNPEDHQQLTPDRSPEQMMQYDELYHKVEVIVGTLPPQCQKVFILSRFEGKKHQEIAGELQIALKTVEVHIRKALLLLKKSLREEWLLLLVLAVW
jgi:RNA polymerase sigma-70 factor (ECF subfamily)